MNNRRVLAVCASVGIAFGLFPAAAATAAPSCVGRDVPVLAERFHPFGTEFVRELALDGGAGDVLTFYAHADRTACPA